MDKAQWAHEFGRLCKAFGKTTSPDLASAYFEALSRFQHGPVGDAVSAAIRESKRFPVVAELVERVRQARPAHLLPASACGVCGGSTWTIHECSPEMPCGADHPKTTRVAVRDGESVRFEEGPFLHDYARRCYQCWTLQRSVA